MKTYNLNDHIIIYPNKKGWDKIKELTEKYYFNMKGKDIDRAIKSAKTQDGGYSCQFWVCIEMFHEMFYNGQNFLETTNVGLPSLTK